MELLRSFMASLRYFLFLLGVSCGYFFPPPMALSSHYFFANRPFSRRVLSLFQLPLVSWRLPTSFFFLFSIFFSFLFFSLFDNLYFPVFLQQHFSQEIYLPLALSAGFRSRRHIYFLLTLLFRLLFFHSTHSFFLQRHFPFLNFQTFLYNERVFLSSHFLICTICFLAIHDRYFLPHYLNLNLDLSLIISLDTGELKDSFLFILSLSLSVRWKQLPKRLSLKQSSNRVKNWLFGFRVYDPSLKVWEVRAN